MHNCEQKSEFLVKNESDILIVDPPRRGLTDNTISQIIKNPPKFIAYISCDPATLTRDTKKLLETYTIKNIYAYDFFPQTPHIESLLILKRQ